LDLLVIPAVKALAVLVIPAVAVLAILEAKATLLDLLLMSLTADTEHLLLAAKKIPLYR
jgi:hypothetical protein